MNEFVTNKYSISSKERPGRSFKSRHSRGGAHSRGRSFGGGALIRGGRSFEGALIRGGRSFEGGGGAHLKIQRSRGVGGSFDRETAVILEAELKKRKELFSHFDFTVENIPIARFPAALSKKYGS